MTTPTLYVTFDGGLFTFLDESSGRRDLVGPNGLLAFFQGDKSRQEADLFFDSNVPDAEVVKIARARGEALVRTCFRGFVNAGVSRTVVIRILNEMM